MTAEQTSGQCRLCVRSFGKRQMTNHLKSCWKQRITPGAKKSTESWFHLVVEGRHAPDYWLHLQTSSKATFGELDSVLRRIWLECCGHLSAFEFPLKRPTFGRGAPVDIFAMMDRVRAGTDLPMDDEDALMEMRLGSKLSPAARFTHQYDFGTTTHLALRVAAEYSAPALKGNIKVLARNEPPADFCVACKKPATQICTECMYEGQATFCDNCAAEHKCGEEMLLPLVNSPRAGACGYTGPSVEP
jgi:hypothetical protein